MKSLSGIWEESNNSCMSFWLVLSLLLALMIKMKDSVLAG